MLLAWRRSSSTFESTAKRAKSVRQADKSDGNVPSGASGTDPRCDRSQASVLVRRPEGKLKKEPEFARNLVAGERALAFHFTGRADPVFLTARSPCHSGMRCRLAVAWHGQSGDDHV